MSELEQKAFYYFLKKRFEENSSMDEALEIISPVFHIDNGKIMLYEDNLSLIKYSEDDFTIQAYEGIFLRIPHSVVKRMWFDENENITLELDVALIYYEQGKSLALKSLCLFYGLADRLNM